MPLTAVAALPERAVYRVKEEGITLTIGRKDSTLTLKAETDSIVPMAVVKTTKTLARKVSVYEEETKPPDKQGKSITVQVIILLGAILAFAIWLENRRLKND